MIGSITVRCDECSSLMKLMNWIHINSEIIDERQMGPEYTHVYEASGECNCGNEVNVIAEGSEYPYGAGVDEWYFECEACSEVEDEEIEDESDFIPITTGISEIDWVLEEKKITELLEIQESYIKMDDEFDNLLVVAPTTSGKTIIAEFLLSEIFYLDRNDGIAIYVAPMHALVNEKLQDFAYFQKLNVLITKNYHKITENSRTILILTPERVLDFLRDYQKFIPLIKLLIFDEVHLIQDFSRGLLYEMIITLLKEALKSKIVALSATLENSEDFSLWLNAKELKGEERPVDLITDCISYTNNENRRDKIKDLVLKFLEDKKQIIIFERTKPSVNSLAAFIAKDVAINDSTQIISQCKDLFNEKFSIDRKNFQCISKRVAFHHADIRSEQKVWIEEAFRNEELKVIVASPTLAMGLNLPADVVIVASHGLGRGELSLYMYKQMIGRAGRYRLSDTGWSYILLPEGRTDLFAKFMGVMPPVKSTLMETWDERRIDYLILWLLGTRLFDSVNYLKKLLSHSFFELMKQDYPSELKTGIFSDEILKRIDPQQSSIDLIDPIIERLENDAFIIRDGDSIDLTPLGLWAAHSQIPIDEFISLFNLFYPKCEINFTSITLKQLIRLIRALSIQGLTPTDKSKEYFPFTIQILNHNGLSPQEYLTGRGRMPTDITLAGVLYLWINEVDIDELLEKIHCYHGSWYRNKRTLIEKLKKFEYHIPEEYKTTNTHVKLRDFTIMLETGVSYKMIPLVKIFGVGRTTALSLFQKYSTLRAIASADIADLSATKVGKRNLGPTLADKIKEELIILESDLSSNLFSLMDWAKYTLRGDNTPFPIHEFKICIQQPEDLYYERKANINLDNKPEKSEFLRDFMSLANAPDPRPRFLIIGIDNSGNIIGANVDNNRIAQIIENGLSPLVNYICKNVQVEGETVPILVIQPSDKVVESNGDIKLNEHTFLRKKEVWARTNQGKKELRGKEIEELAEKKKKNL